MSNSLPTFRPFDPHGQLDVYFRRLPHWRQAGATYFVTIRQNDSIPAGVLAEWRDLRERFCRAHRLDPAWLKSDPKTFAAKVRQIDGRLRRAFEREQARQLHYELDNCHGSCVLRHKQPQKEIQQSLTHFHGSRLWLGDSVVMPNHVHAIVTPIEEWKLEDVLGSVKRWTGRRINVWMEEKSNLRMAQCESSQRQKFWQRESYDRIIRDVEELSKYRQYIANNPKKSMLPEEYSLYVAADWLDQFAKRPHQA